VLAAGAVAGSLAYRRRAAGRSERVELYAESGSMALIAAGTPEGDRLLERARDMLALAS
jgi:hypothetical protein